VSDALEQISAITMFVADKQRTKAFYERAFDAPAIWEDDNSVVFKFGELLVNLLVETEAPGLIAPARVASADSGARFQLTIGVDDADGVCARLRERGVELLNGPMDRPWGVRTAAFADPDGHVWEVAQQLG
jgi:catechol 2,3-dioxygenase-like lactoylglutathione lyase family enzyme